MNDRSPFQGNNPGALNVRFRMCVDFWYFKWFRSLHLTSESLPFVDNLQHCHVQPRIPVQTELLDVQCAGLERFALSHLKSCDA